MRLMWMTVADGPAESVRYRTKRGAHFGRLRTAATAGQDVDDSMLTASVKAKLTEDSTTKAYQINVGTQKGVVQLTGFVDSTTMKTRAGEVARSVDGVKDVRNDLEIRQK